MTAVHDKEITELIKQIYSLKPHTDCPHDAFIFVTLEEAITAAQEGNFGVGAVLIDGKGEILQRGHNRVFKPHMRSDIHAEMDVLTRFEERSRHGNTRIMRDLALYTSLEPCPMCLARLITSGVGKVYYAATDSEGGMVSRLDQMPPIWQELASAQEFSLAQCSSKLSDIASAIFRSTVDKCNRRLREQS